MDENTIIGHIDAFKVENLSRLGHLLKSLALLEERIRMLEEFQSDMLMAEAIRYQEWCKTHGVDP